MADTKMLFDENSEAVGTSESLLSSMFQRKIEFHPARKHYSGFSNGRGNFQLESFNPSSSDPYRQDSNYDQFSSKGKNKDRSEFLENRLDPELSFEITFRRIGAGLENLGNTCFLNSVVQCLTYTEPLAAYLQSGKHQSSCRIAGFCALCAIQKHVSRALQSSGRILAPKDLVSNLRCISRTFRNARQEDAHEYMVNLLESMHKCCLPSGMPSGSPSAYDKSLVHRIFGGRLRSQVKCTQCSHCSDTYDPFLDLSLDIVKADSLQKAFKNFTAPELLDGGEKQYQCERCKQKVRAYKQLTVCKAPNVLTIHLKRFHLHNPQGKIHKKIQFGPTFDLKPFVSGSYDGELKYTLYGVLVHHGGSTRSGHYYCYVRTSTGMWYTLDDNQVFHVGDRTVLDQQAYMLFYVRDKRRVVQKKPLAVAQKESLKVNIDKNITASIVKQGSIETRFSDPPSSTHVARKETISINSSKMVVSKEASVCQDSGVVKESSSVSSSSKPSLLKDKLQEISLKPVKSMEKTAHMRISHANESNGTNEELSISTLSNLIKNSSGTTSQKVGVIPNSNQVEGSSSSSVTKGALDVKGSEPKPRRKLKRKLHKCQVGSTLFKVSLSLRKKKKHKRGKHLTTTNNLNEEQIQDRISSDLAPSMSENTRTVSWASIHSPRKSSKQQSEGADGASAKILNSNGKPLEVTICEESKRSDEGKNYVFETSDQARKSCVPSLISNKVDDIPPSQKGSKSEKMLADSVVSVPRWDGISLPPQIVESDGVGITTIGYVADEWDEEYDRGKRKKVRSYKHSFGGPNPFQEIATENLQCERLKTIPI